LEVYLFFIADDRLDVSTTTYLGRLEPTNVDKRIEPLVIEQVFDTLIEKVSQAKTDQEAMNSVHKPLLNKFEPIVGLKRGTVNDGSSFRHNPKQKKRHGQR